MFVKQLPLDLLARREVAHGDDGLCALTFRAAASEIAAITAVNQLVLMTLEKSRREGRIARKLVQTRAAERSPNMLGKSLR
jgi:hypothetical protein